MTVAQLAKLSYLREAFMEARNICATRQGILGSVLRESRSLPACAC